MKKTDNRSIIVWVSILKQPRLPLRDCRFGQNLGQNSGHKVLPSKITFFGLWLFVWRVERRNSWFILDHLCMIPRHSMNNKPRCKMGQLINPCCTNWFLLIFLIIYYPKFLQKFQKLIPKIDIANTCLNSICPLKWHIGLRRLKS